MKHVKDICELNEGKIVIKDNTIPDPNLNILDDSEFYNLLQYYRHSPRSNQKDIIRAFEDIKKFINDNFILKDEKIVKDWLLKQDAKKYNL